jgi:hypothetical protein
MLHRLALAGLFIGFFAPFALSQKESARQPSLLAWETVAADKATKMVTKRASVPGGWLVLVQGDDSTSVTFFPDAGHRWADDSPSDRKPSRGSKPERSNALLERNPDTDLAEQLARAAREKTEARDAAARATEEAARAKAEAQKLRAEMELLKREAERLQRLLKATENSTPGRDTSTTGRRDHPTETLFEVHVRVGRTDGGVDVLLAGTLPSTNDAAAVATHVGTIRDYGMVGLLLVPLILKTDPDKDRALRAAVSSIKAQTSGRQLTLTASIPKEAVQAGADLAQAGIRFAQGVVGTKQAATADVQAREEKSSVSGSVTVDGKPLAEGKVAFHPAKGKAAIAEIKEGAYALELPAGDVVVTIEHPALPKKYSDPKASALRATIKTGKNTLDFNITSK